MPNQPAIKKHPFDLEGIKLLIGSGSIAATIAFWSLFANVDRVAKQADLAAAATAPSVAYSIALPPLPTLISLNLPTGPEPTGPAATPVSTEGLRTVSQPQPTSRRSNGPVVVQGNRSSGPATSSGSS
ncbi:MAG: hypothetical protein WD751_11045 [Anaerolineales bacterium]